MPNIVFEDRAVAFIDVLEFKSVVESFDSGDRTFLEELFETLGAVVPRLDGKVSPSIRRDLIPKYISISDSIILNPPLTSEKMSGYLNTDIKRN
ncbi:MULTISPECIES: hypothetical protein [unclassified Pantoea]|uniref:hypothetical protein n=1 Tax=unclassified Pantoea TaxID=2630326 RepID=UPI001CD7375D|nr:MULTISPECIES: hypothetical protein [unclassified Pantoea]MCA1175238.1 hypothetical protein [Pantoea sp. alder69]MCA1250200.1 hypothetical protein [Pantoea sp. alder70]MCA1263845.1 hypothetical protein [Pantoea sp. alder81]